MMKVIIYKPCFGRVVSRTCMKAWMSSNFGQFATESWPLIDVRIEFFAQYLENE